MDEPVVKGLCIAERSCVDLRDAHSNSINLLIISVSHKYSCHTYFYYMILLNSGYHLNGADTAEQVCYSNHTLL